MFAPLCHCVGRPLRFIEGECFTCGRATCRHWTAEEQRHANRPGYMALLAKVHSIQRKRRPRQRLGPKTRRVVIEPAVPKAVTPRGERSSEHRAVEWLTRTF